MFNVRANLFCWLSVLFSVVNADSGNTVTFVCEHGVAKSVVATYYFNQRAKALGLPFVAVARGLSPEADMQTATRTGLQKDGFDTTAFVAAKVSTADVADSRRVISIDIKEEPVFIDKAKLTEWDGVPPISQNYDVARDNLVQRIEALLNELSRERN